VVTVTCAHVMTLNRLCTHMLNCAVGHMFVVKPWGKDNEYGLEFDVMV
jgi:hypothetical protein